MGAVVGGYTSVAKNNAGVLKAYKLATAAIANASDVPVDSYKLDSAQVQVVNGKNYNLIITANSGSTSTDWDVIVYAPLSGPMNVTSVNPLVVMSPMPTPDNTDVVGGYSPVDTNDAGVQAAFDFVKENLSSTLGSTPKSVELTSAATQVVAGTNYNLKMKVVTDEGTSDWNATVFKALPSDGGDLKLTSLVQESGPTNPTASSITGDALSAESPAVAPSSDAINSVRIFGSLSAAAAAALVYLI